MQIKNETNATRRNSNFTRFKKSSKITRTIAYYGDDVRIKRKLLSSLSGVFVRI